MAHPASKESTDGYMTALTGRRYNRKEQLNSATITTNVLITFLCEAKYE